MRNKQEESVEIPFHTQQFAGAFRTRSGNLKAHMPLIDADKNKADVLLSMDE
jgi:hypothetical protein